MKYFKVNMFRSRGFTLIELLVVISIIGLLSSVVLASLNSARAKGKDAAIKSELLQMRNAIELIRSSATDYSFIQSSSPKVFTNLLAVSVGGYIGKVYWLTPTSDCTSSYADIESICRSLFSSGANNIYVGALVPSASGKDVNQYYSVAVTLASDSTKHICIGSSGNTSSVTAPESTMTSNTTLGCPANP